MINLKNVSKRYSLSHDRPVLLKNLFIPRKISSTWALKGVSLTIPEGETVGIIGENGAGKSTLLKIITGITPPTKGKMKVSGRIGSLIELGAGFHPDLTGKENVYLNGALLGLTKTETDEKYKDIVDFADLSEYIHQPIRTYSSGMKVRLGFSIAAQLEPDILLIDEVLAVGDESFQRKSIEKIGTFKKFKKTILFVSHNLSLVEQVCNRTIWIDKGKVVYDGKTLACIDHYVNSLREKEKKVQRKSRRHKKQLTIEKVEILDKNERLKGKFEPKEFAKIRIYYKANKRIDKPIFGVHIYSNHGYYCHGTTTLMKNKNLGPVEGKGFIDYNIKKLHLLENSGWANSVTKYYVSAFSQIEEENIPKAVDYYKNARSFFIKHRGRVDQHGIVFFRRRVVN